MNDKGFTTVELILTMVLVITIMFSITTVTYVYRDRSVYEETNTEIINYKNTLTKIIYDDILDSSNKAVKIERVSDKVFKITKENNSTINLEIISSTNKVGIKYNDIEYIIPGSDNSLVTFEEAKLYPTDYSDVTPTNLYSLDITFSHQGLEEPFKIHFVINNT